MRRLIVGDRATVERLAERLKAHRWALLLRYVSDRIAPTIGPFRPATGVASEG